MEINTFWKVLVLAALIEAIMNTIKPIWETEKRTPQFFINLAVGFVVAIGVNVLAGLDLFKLFGIPLLYPIIGTILTGVLLSRGSNFIHDLIKTLYMLAKNLEANLAKIKGDTQENVEVSAPKTFVVE